MCCSVVARLVDMGKLMVSSATLVSIFHFFRIVHKQYVYVANVKVNKHTRTHWIYLFLQSLLALLSLFSFSILIFYLCIMCLIWNFRSYWSIAEYELVVTEVYCQNVRQPLPMPVHLRTACPHHKRQKQKNHWTDVCGLLLMQISPNAVVEFGFLFIVHKIDGKLC